MLLTLLKTAKEKYNVTCVNGTTYNAENEMPFLWYKKIGFEKVDDLYLIQGDVQKIIRNLKD